MEVLVTFLQNSPLVNLVMFTITVLAAVISIYLGWKRFRDDILLKKITVPFYMYLVILFIIALVALFWPAVEDRPKILRTIEGESFGVQRIIVDGKRFVNCKFRKTELVFRGEASSEIGGCTFINPGFTFAGPAATTVKIMKTMYQIPQFRPLIENTFKAIKEGDLSEAVPPSDAADD